ncbi:sialidase family protein [Chitinophaga varians]|uniref:sialidase family protein n=1 Tax=Chitinophaga varians TaxID=2202339 RepID=UPI00165F83E0|nr:sialidase family protein [Chitinophaga varians]MBC9909847.1 exo-alpha-sialidase [Chitinophaga varians]
MRNYGFVLLCLLAGVFPAMGQSHWRTVKEELLFLHPPFNNCHASTLAEDAGGNLHVACFGGTHEGAKDVVIWAGTIPAHGGVTPTVVATGVLDDTVRYPCWNPVLLPLKNKLVLFYKVGPNPREWWGMMKTSADNGRSWSAAVRLPANVIGPVKNKALVLGNNVLCPSSVEEEGGHWRIQIEQTDTHLRQWKVIPIDTSSKLDVIQPSILHYHDGKLQLLCRSKQGKVVQSWSADNGVTWSALTETSLPNPNSGTDAVTLKNGLQLIVYNPDLPGKDWFNGRSRLRVAASRDGVQWKDVAVLENGTTEEFSYPAIIQTRDGLVHITYTYDRKNIKHVVLQEEK